MSRTRPPALKLLTIAILALLPALSAYAAPQSQGHQRKAQRDDARNESREDGDSRSSLSDAVRRVERDTRGEVLSAERVQYDGRDMHRVKVVDDQGRVRVFMQDPRSESAEESSSRGSDQRGSRRRPPPARDDDD